MMPHTLTQARDACIEQIIRFSVVSKERLEHLTQLASRIGPVRGDIVECGVAAGGSAAMIGWTVRDSGRGLWLYDSFQGMPRPTGKDGPNSEQYFGANLCSSERAREALQIAGFPLHNVRIIEGWFHDTVRREGPEEIAFLHIDADWHDSVRDCLEAFYDRVSFGGVIVLDDFGYWPGCRRAFYEFCALRQIAPRIERFNDQAWWVKGLGE